jgi:tRNA G18 (ribose-2'-O)-methylase SpoU
MGAKVWQPYRWIGTEAAIAEAKRDGYRIYGLTLGENSTSAHKVEWIFPAAIVLGEEKRGLTSQVRELCDELIAIPMFGLMGSLNVGMAGAIAVYEATLAYSVQNKDFQPVRNASRKLLGLEPADYADHLREDA